MSLKLKDSELKSILAEVETELTGLFKAEDDNLEGTDPAVEDPAEVSAAPVDEAAEGSPVEASPGDESASVPAEDVPGEESPEMDGDEIDPEELQAEYAELPIEALKAHYMAAKAALFEAMGASGEGTEESAPPAAPPVEAAPAMKSETSVAKSEPMNAKIAELESQLDLMAKAINLGFGTPVRKAITSVNYVPKGGDVPVEKELSKSEIKEKIRSVLRTGKLSKSQEDMLFSYSIGNTSYDNIKDLLDIK